MKAQGWITVLLLVLAECLCEHPATRENEDYITLALDWAMNWGTWGPQVYCPEGFITYGFELKVEGEEADDDTAMNGIKLYCGDKILIKNGQLNGQPEENEFTITSTVQKWGQWRGLRQCSEGGYLTGLRMKSEDDQGFWVDDTAANDLEMQCNWSTETLNGGGDQWGTWSNWATCPKDWAICGIETRVEEDSATDDTALNNVRMFCCNVNATMTH